MHRLETSLCNLCSSCVELAQAKGFRKKSVIVWRTAQLEEEYEIGLAGKVVEKKCRRFEQREEM